MHHRFREGLFLFDFFFDGVSYTVVAQGCFRHKFLFFPIGLIFVLAGGDQQ